MTLDRGLDGRFTVSTHDDVFLEKWLNEEFSSKATIHVYRCGLNKFCRILSIENMQDYFQGLTETKLQEDFKRFVASLNGSPSKTVSIYMTAVRVFFADKGFEINSVQKMRRRGFIPRRIRAETQDRIPTIEELRTILNYADSEGRALILFLLSSGCRIGETLA